MRNHVTMCRGLCLSGSEFGELVGSSLRHNEVIVNQIENLFWGRAILRQSHLYSRHNASRAAQTGRLVVYNGLA